MTYNDYFNNGFQFEPYSFFFSVWPWIGLGAAVVLLLFIFCTKHLRLYPDRCVWRDPSALAWMGAVAYMLHNIEEYGVDLYGHHQAFNTLMVQLMGSRISEAAYLSCNLGLVWVVGPLTAIMVNRGYVRMAAGMALFELINGLSHIAQAINLGLYNPGLLTACVIFVPLCCWTLYVCYGKEHLPRLDILWLFLGGLLYHVFLAFGILGATRFGMSAAMQGLTMVVAAVLLFFIWWLVGRKGRVVNYLQNIAKTT